MTGKIATSSVDAISCNVNTDGIRILGGTNFNDGGSFVAYGNNSQVNTGGFIARATIDGSSVCDLVGLPTGKLTWCGNTVAMGKDYLPLVGGEMKGMIGSVSGTSNPVLANTEGGVLGGNLYLFKRGDPTYKGGFILRAVAENGSECDLRGQADGMLTWDYMIVPVIKDTTMIWTGNNSVLKAPAGGTWLCIVLGWRTDSITMLPQFQWMYASSKTSIVAGGTNLYISGVSDAAMAWCIRIA